MTDTDRLNLRPCEPPWWASNGHAQTILGRYLPCESIGVNGERVIYDLPDGDQLLGFYYKGTNNCLVYLFHGLAGDTDSSYISRIALNFNRKGYHVVCVNFRGAGAGAGLASNIYHFGSWHDLLPIFSWGHKRFPSLKHLCVGFSLGGGLVLNLLGRESDHHLLPDYSITVNSPLAIMNASDRLNTGWSKIYNKKFVYDIREYFKQKHSVGLSQDIALPSLFEEMQSIDDRITSRLAGFDSGYEYYEKTSPGPFAKNILKPTIMITTEDDPIVPLQDYFQTELSKTTHVHIEKVGGHLGYLHKRDTPLGSKHWLDYALVNFANHFLQEHS